MRTFFRIVSAILHPLLLPVFGMALLFQAGTFKMYPLEYQLFVTGLIFLNMTLLPATGVFLLKKTGQISDLDVSVRSERVFPYIISLITSISAIALLIRYQMPWMVVKLFIGSAFATVLAFIITFKWKISAHVIAFGCLVAASIIISINQGLNPTYFFVALFLLAGLQATSRVYLKAHTLGQVAAGFTLGFISVSAIYFSIP
jgi:membrane-associated phospholipid phosphatase